VLQLFFSSSSGVKKYLRLGVRHSPWHRRVRAVSTLLIFKRPIDHRISRDSSADWNAGEMAGRLASQLRELGGQGQLSAAESSGLISKCSELASCLRAIEDPWGVPAGDGTAAAEVLARAANALAEQCPPNVAQRLLRALDDEPDHLLARLAAAFQHLWAAVGSATEEQQPAAQQALGRLCTALHVLLERLYGELDYEALIAGDVEEAWRRHPKLTAGAALTFAQARASQVPHTTCSASQGPRRLLKGLLNGAPIDLMRPFQRPGIAGQECGRNEAPRRPTPQAEER
jgi:hypothetical protein